MLLHAWCSNHLAVRLPWGKSTSTRSWLLTIGRAIAGSVFSWASGRVDDWNKSASLGGNAFPRRSTISLGAPLEPRSHSTSGNAAEFAWRHDDVFGRIASHAKAPEDATAWHRRFARVGGCSARSRFEPGGAPHRGKHIQPRAQAMKPSPSRSQSCLYALPFENLAWCNRCG
jgi:hypothetical protein